MAEYERISITIEPDLLDRLDASVAAHGHGNRSEAIRDLIRARLIHESAPDEQVTASFTVVFDHQQRALADKLTDHAHHHHGIVLSTLHVHMDHDTCMEVSVLQGRRADVEHYAAHVHGMKGVLHAQLAIAAASR